MQNGHVGSRDRLNELRGSRDHLDSGRNSPRSARATRDTLSRANKPSSFQPREFDANSSPGSTLDKKLLKQRQDAMHHDLETTDDDGFSEHEFDDYTTNDEDASGKNSFRPAVFPPRVENQIDSMKPLPQINEMPQYSSESSVDLSGKNRSLSSFHHLESPLTPTNRDMPPTPPPPYSGDIPLRSLRTTSPTMSNTSSNRPVPQPRHKPTPPPRPGLGSKDSLKQSSRDDVSNLQKHLSQGNLNYYEKKPDWLADQVRETSASETESETETETEGSYPILDNKGFIGSRESIPNTMQSPGYTPSYNRSDGTSYNSPWKDTFMNSSMDTPSSRGSRNMDNMDYLRGNYSNPAFVGSRENLPQNMYDNEPIDNSGYSNNGYQPDSALTDYQNLPTPNYAPPSYPGSPRHDQPYGNIPAPPYTENASPEYPMYRIPSQNSVPMSSSQENLPRDLASMDYRMGSQHSLPQSRVDGSIPDVSGSSVHDSHPALAYMDDMNDSYDHQEPHAYEQRDTHQPHTNYGSRDYINHSGDNVHGSRDNLNGVLYLNNDGQNRRRRPEPIETEI